MILIFNQMIFTHRSNPTIQNCKIQDISLPSSTPCFDSFSSMLLFILLCFLRCKTKPTINNKMDDYTAMYYYSEDKPESMSFPNMWVMVSRVSATHQMKNTSCEDNLVSFMSTTILKLKIRERESILEHK